MNGNTVSYDERTSEPARLDLDSVPEDTSVWRDPVTLVLLAAAVVIGVVFPAVVAAVTGSLAIPHNDAWSYSRIAQEFGRSGDIVLLGWNRSSLFGQFMLLGPLAQWLTVQQLFVSLLAVVGLWAVYDLLAPTIGRRRAAFGTLVLACWPAFGLLATTFMADVPALASMALCLALGRRALAGGSAWYLAGALAVGGWGVTIREQAIAAPVAVLLAAAYVTWRSRRFRWSTLVGWGAALAVALVVFEVWRRSFNAEDPPVVAVPPALLSHGLETLVRGYFTAALGLAPAVLLVARPWRWVLRDWIVAAVAAAVAVLAVHDYHALTFFPPNYLDPHGPYPAAGNGLPALAFPVTGWWAVVGIACASGVLLAPILVRQVPRLDPLNGVFLLLMVGGNLATALSGQSVFDRYWMLAVPSLLAAVLAERRESPGALGVPVFARLAGIATAMAVAAASLGLTLAGIAYDTARWKAGEQIVATGVPATDVDAGLEWRGYHSREGMVPAGSWVFPGSRSCYVVSANPLPGKKLLRTVDYRTFVLFGHAQLWVYDDSATTCAK